MGLDGAFLPDVSWLLYLAPFSGVSLILNNVKVKDLPTTNPIVIVTHNVFHLHIYSRSTCDIIVYSHSIAGIAGCALV